MNAKKKKMNTETFVPAFGYVWYMTKSEALNIINSG